VLTAEHNGYHRIGISHRRRLEWLEPGQWEVTDWVSSLKNSKEHRLTLQWLIMEGEWTVEEDRLMVIGKRGKVSLTVRAQNGDKIDTLERRLVRGGMTLYGKDNGLENEGCISPTTEARARPVV